MKDVFNSPDLMIAQKSLDALWLRQKVISNNLANSDTPGYKCQSVAFENILEKALKSTGTDLSSLKPKVMENDSTQMREDGNNVDREEQNIELARTQIQYEVMVRLISDDLSRMRYAISGGK